MISTTDPSQVPVNKNVSTTTLITKEIESRIKKSPDYVFEVFLEIREPANENDQPEILLKYPLDFVDDMLKSVANFVYPCKISLGEQDEHYAFAVLDNTAVLFRFGYCRRSNRESTCLCILSYYPWFETFYTILNDISQIINYRTPVDLDTYLSLLHNYKLLTIDEFNKREINETIQIKCPYKEYFYQRPDLRKLPAVPSSHNFAMMYSCLGSDLMLQVFSHILFERRMLFVSSKLFHLTTCACGCLQLIFPMHWQSIFVPILPSSMTWLCQCTVPYIIGIHTNIFSTLTISELGDIVIVNIDERTIETQYDDLSRLPKHLYRGMKKGIQRSEKLPGDSLAKVFLRAMAFTVGSYSNGFIFKDDKLDFDRDQYLRQYENTPIHEYMSAVSHTQMFEQFSRYRTDSLITSFDDEFDLEVKNVQQIQQSKKIKANKKFHRILEKYVKYGSIPRTSADKHLTLTHYNRLSTLDNLKTANPIIEQVQNRAEKLGTVINRAGQRVIIEASTVRHSLTTLDINDVIKRNEYRMKDDNVPNNQKVDLEQQNQHLSTQKSQLYPSISELHDEKSIPYERFSTGNVNFGATYTSVHNPPSSTSDSSEVSSPELTRKEESLILIDTEPDTLSTNPITTVFNPLLPSPVTSNAINPANNQTQQQDMIRPIVHDNIKQLQIELKHKMQNFDGKRIDPKEEYASKEANLIKKLVRQFDPLDEMSSSYTTKMTENNLTTAPYFRKNVDFLSDPSIPVMFHNELKPITTTSAFRHPSTYDIPSNRVNHILQNIQSSYGPNPLSTVRTAPPSLSPYMGYPSLPQNPSTMNFPPHYPSVQPYMFQQQQIFSEIQSPPPDPLLSTSRKAVNSIDTQSLINSDILFDPLQQQQQQKERLYPVVPSSTSLESRTRSHQTNLNSTTNLIDF